MSEHGLISFNDLCIQLENADSKKEMNRLRLYFNKAKKQYPLIQARLFSELYKEKLDELNLELKSIDGLFIQFFKDLLE